MTARQPDLSTASSATYFFTYLYISMQNSVSSELKDPGTEAEFIDVNAPRKWDKSLKSYPHCYSQSPPLTAFTSPPPLLLSKSGLKLVPKKCTLNIVYGNLKSENSQDYAQKPQQKIVRS